ncbi:hypothetical protein C8F01DRAFT_1266940 [Mycena amicta]|nr:hypothetical protein C8F01DRAFT_1266940 [Mycena amicta]
MTSLVANREHAGRPHTRKSISASTIALSRRLEEFLKNSAQSTTKLCAEAKQFEAQALKSLAGFMEHVNEQLQRVQAALAVVQSKDTVEDALAIVKNVVKETHETFRVGFTAWTVSLKQTCDTASAAAENCGTEAFNLTEHAVNALGALVETIVQQARSFVETEREASRPNMLSTVKAPRTIERPSPLAHKARRFRLDVPKRRTTPPLHAPPPIPDPPYCFDSMNNVVEYVPPSEPPAAISVPSAPPTTTANGLETSYEELEARSHRVREETNMANQRDKDTAKIYARHSNAYISWFDNDRARLARDNPRYCPIPAMPITPAKKRKLNDSSGAASTSTCGVQHIKQVISALEYMRFEKQHLYPNIPEAHIALRTDRRIKSIEEAAAHNETQRVKKSHSLKAVGTHADTYNETQLQEVVSHFLRPKHPSDIWRAMRDRAMMLIQSSIAFRGDSTRNLLWSDLYMHDVPIIAKGLNEKRPPKHNQTGCVDEHAVFRHRIVELCAVGAIAFFYFSHFHILNNTIPGFALDFTDPGYGDYGRWDWYTLHVFSISKDCTKEMSYSAHRDRVKKAYDANNTWEHGASAAEVKALGGWNENGSYRACYDRAFPLEAMLAAAMFNSKEPQSHFLARDDVHWKNVQILGERKVCP